MLQQTPQKTLTERQQRIYDFMCSNSVGVLASIDTHGSPHGTVIYHTVDTAFNVSFLTKKHTNKYANLLRNSQVVYVIFEPESQTVVQVVGEALEVYDSSEVNGIAAAIFMTSLNTSEGGIPPIAKLNAGEYAAFRIVPKQVRMACYARPDSGDYDKIFESLESFELTENND